jgi:hypothetical protein
LADRENLTVGQSDVRFGRRFGLNIPQSRFTAGPQQSHVIAMDGQLRACGSDNFRIRRHMVPVRVRVEDIFDSQTAGLDL